MNSNEERLKLLRERHEAMQRAQKRLLRGLEPPDEEQQNEREYEFGAKFRSG